MLRLLPKNWKWTEKKTLDAFEVLFAMVHGYASLIANNAMEYDPEALRKMLSYVGESLMNNNNV